MSRYVRPRFLLAYGARGPRASGDPGQHSPRQPMKVDPLPEASDAKAQFTTALHRWPSVLKQARVLIQWGRQLCSWCI